MANVPVRNAERACYVNRANDLLFSNGSVGLSTSSIAADPEVIRWRLPYLNLSSLKNTICMQPATTIVLLIVVGEQLDLAVSGFLQNRLNLTMI